jgi:uncharacterized delta-60 repeat protein
MTGLRRACPKSDVRFGGLFPHCSSEGETMRNHQLSLHGKFGETNPGSSSHEHLFFKHRTREFLSLLLAGLLVSLISTRGYAQAGSADTTFMTGSSVGDGAIVLLPNGKILGGSTAYGSIARLNADGTRDASFNAHIFQDAPFQDLGGNVYAIAAQSDGKVIIGGYFATVDGKPRPDVARLNADGSSDDAFNANAPTLNFDVHGVILQNDGRIVLGGAIEQTNGVNNGGNVVDMLRLNTDGTWDKSFTTSTEPSRTIATMVAQPDGKILLGGNFSMVNGTVVAYVARLNANGSLDNSFKSDFVNAGSQNNGVHGLAVQKDGKIIVSGAFTAANGVPRNNIARLNPNGSLDASFNASVTGMPSTGLDVPGVAVQSDGKIVIVGSFEQVNGVARTNIARLNLDGSLDLSFKDTIVGFGQRAAVQPDGKILAGGGFHVVVRGTFHNYSLARLNPEGSYPLNVATRGNVLKGDNVMIGGFILSGNEPHKIIIRGIGPSLGSVGVAGALADPTLELHQGSTTLATNDNWKINDQTQQSQEADIRATTLSPTNDLESAILMTLNPGAYTAILAGKSGGTGTGLVEIYDLAQTGHSGLANISTRGFVDAGDNVLIGGFIVGGGTTGDTATVLVRAMGPSLANAGVQGALADPTLELHNATGTTIASNDNWKTASDGSSQQADIEATTIPPTNDLESALVQTLPPGNYTAVVRGKNNATGIALVEVYNLQ